MKKISWFISNGIFAGFIYYGIFKGNENAIGVAVFIAWACAILSLFTVSEKVIDAFKEKGFSVPHYVDAIFDLSVILAFAWGGYFWTAGAYFLQLTMLAGLRVEVEKK